MTLSLKARKSTPPPCREACPAGVDVSRYVRFIKNGEFEQARAVVREAIPFSAVCGYACTHPCELRCARIQYDESVAIRLLKRAAEENGKREPDAVSGKAATDKRIAIVGAGPCGLTAAYYLSLMGHKVTVFEALEHAGGMLWYGIPSYRLPREVIQREIELIKQQGVEIITRRPVEDLKKLLDEGFAAVLLASGAWDSQKMGIQGERQPHVLNGLDFLRDINEGRRPRLGKKVVVVGGGNTAIDAARSSVRLGAEVRLLYRRRMEDMPASVEEITDALEEGVKIELLTAPVKIETGIVTCVKMALGSLDGSGRPVPEPLAGSEYEIVADTLIMAVGQFVNGKPWGVAQNSKGGILADPETLATSLPGIFVAGDAATGPSTIIRAIAQGKQAAAAIDRYAGGSGSLDFLINDEADAEIFSAAPRGCERPDMEKIPNARRFNSFDLTEIGLDKTQAVYEAGRCLACDIREYEITVNAALCKECGYCREICKLDIFAVADTFNSSGYRPTQAIRPNRCVGCLKCLYICPDFAIAIKNIN